MPIALSSISPRNIKAIHTKTGAIAYPTAIADLGNNTFQYSLERFFSSTDAGEWKVFTSDTNPVLNDAGQPVVEQQISVFTVLIESTAIYNFVMPWELLFKAATPSGYRVSAQPPDLNDADAEIWHQYTIAAGNKWTSRISFNANGHWIEHLVRTGTFAKIDHTTGIPQGNNIYTNLLPGGTEIRYSPTRAEFIHSAIFAQGAYTSIDWKAFSDAAGTVEINGRNGGQAVPSNVTRANIGIGELPSTAMAIRFYFTGTDGTITDYLVPLG